MEKIREVNRGGEERGLVKNNETGKKGEVRMVKGEL